MFHYRTARQHDDTLLKRGPLGRSFKTKPALVTKSARAAHNTSTLVALERKWKAKLEVTPFNPFIEEYQEDVVFKRLCRGETLLVRTSIYKPLSQDTSTVSRYLKCEHFFFWSYAHDFDYSRLAIRQNKYLRNYHKSL
jgi:hypothetical protein